MHKQINKQKFKFKNRQKNTKNRKIQEQNDLKVHRNKNKQINTS